MSDVTESKRIKTAAELARWLAANNTTPAELFAGPKHNKARALTAAGAPDQQIVTLQNSATTGVVKWLDLADLVSWTTPPTRKPATSLNELLGQPLADATKQRIQRDTWVTGTTDLAVDSLPVAVGQQLPGVAVYLRGAKRGAHVSARVTVSSSGSSDTFTQLRASFDLTTGNGERRVEYVEGYLRAGLGAVLGRSVFVQCRRTTYGGKERVEELVLDMGLYRLAEMPPRSGRSTIV